MSDYIMNPESFHPGTFSPLQYRKSRREHTMRDPQTKRDRHYAWEEIITVFVEVEGHEIELGQHSEMIYDKP